MMLLPLPLLLLANAPGDAGKAPIPAPLRAALDAAMAGGREDEVLTVSKYAQQAAPDSAEAIARLIAAWQDNRRQLAEQRLREASFLALVHGHVEVGATVTTGNSRNLGFNGAVDATREGLRWRHKVRLLADYQRSAGIVSRERFLAAYEPNYKWSDRAYGFGLAQIESDRLLGFTERYTASAGAGYSAIRSKRMKLDLEASPALRLTYFTDDTSATTLAGRASLTFDWKLSAGLSFNQAAIGFLESDNSTVSTTSAFKARLLGPLSAALTYNVQYESAPPPGRRTTDTTTRASLFFDF